MFMQDVEIERKSLLSIHSLIFNIPLENTFMVAMTALILQLLPPGYLIIKCILHGRGGGYFYIPGKDRGLDLSRGRFYIKMFLFNRTFFIKLDKARNVACLR